MILSIVNQKGGVGKTTTAVNLATCLASKGQRVLLVDMDAQGHCSKALGVTLDANAPTVYELMKGQVGPESRDALSVGLDLSPSDIALSDLDARILGKAHRLLIVARSAQGARRRDVT